jgi:hypothetical protein
VLGLRDGRLAMIDRLFCQAPHPDLFESKTKRVKMDGEWIEETEDVPYVFCMRLLDHPGEHKAFVYSISTPDSWE